MEFDSRNFTEFFLLPYEIKSLIVSKIFETNFDISEKIIYASTNSEFKNFISLNNLVCLNFDYSPFNKLGEEAKHLLKLKKAGILSFDEIGFTGINPILDINLVTTLCNTVNFMAPSLVAKPSNFVKSNLNQTFILNGTADFVGNIVCINTSTEHALMDLQNVKSGNFSVILNLELNGYKLTRLDEIKYLISNYLDYDFLRRFHYKYTLNFHIGVYNTKIIFVDEPFEVLYNITDLMKSYEISPEDVSINLKFDFIYGTDCEIGNILSQLQNIMPSKNVKSIFLNLFGLTKPDDFCSFDLQSYFPNVRDISIVNFNPTVFGIYEGDIRFRPKKINMHFQMPIDLHRNYPFDAADIIARQTIEKTNKVKEFDFNKLNLNGYITDLKISVDLESKSKYIIPMFIKSLTLYFVMNKSFHGSHQLITDLSNIDFSKAINLQNIEFRLPVLSQNPIIFYNLNYVPKSLLSIFSFPTSNKIGISINIKHGMLNLNGVRSNMFIYHGV